MSLASALGAVNASDFAEGQVWAYRARAGEESSTLLINKIESDPDLGAIYHVSVSGVRVKNPHAPSGLTTDLPHFPVSNKTLEQSCIKIVGHGKPNPQYLEGYAEWRGAFNRGNAGIFTISVAEIVDIVESTLNR